MKEAVVADGLGVDAEIAHDSLCVRSSVTVARRIADAVRTLDVRRFDLIHGAVPSPRPPVGVYGT
jgi:hypothetical protein